ncbi:MAG: hypothetical protein ACE5DR_02945 [Thermodesulfobacteriota bacterium]
MRLSTPISCLVLFISIFSTLPSAAYGSESSFAFNNTSAISGWSFEGVESARFTGGGLFLSGKNSLKMGYPSGISVPMRRVAMDLRLKALQSLVFNIRLKTTNGWETSKTLKVQAIAGIDEEKVLRLYLGKALGPGAEGRETNQIENLVITFFGTDKVGVRLGSLRFYEPGVVGLFSLYWGEFWRPDFITGTTIGFVTTPEAGGVGLISMLYALIFLCSIAAIVFYFARGDGFFSRKAAKVMVIIFLFAGLLFTLRMDYNWLSIFRDDVKTLSGADVDKRIRMVNHNAYDGILDLVDFVKRTVPLGRTLRPAANISQDSQLAAIARYYMLPHEDSREADLIWTFGGRLRVDPRTGALYDADGGLVEPRVRLFARHTENAAIYEVIK